MAQKEAALPPQGEPLKTEDGLKTADSSVATCCSSPASPTPLRGSAPPPCLARPPRLDEVPSLSLTEEQRGKVLALRQFVDSLLINQEEAPPRAPAAGKERGWLSGMFSRSSTSATPKGKVEWLTWEEVLWLQSDLVLWRYLRSYSWEEKQAQKQLLQTVWWRRHNKPHHVRPEDVRATAARGSVYRKGFDVHGHPIVYFKPGREPAQSSKSAQQYTLYTMEKAINSIDRSTGRDQLIFLVDFTGFTISQVPSMDLSKEVVGILNDHYTDILARAYLLDAPSYFDTVWRFVRLMLHPQTADKVQFIQTSDKKQLARLLEDIPASFLEQSLGGTSPVAYDHELYWEGEDAHHKVHVTHTEERLQELKQDPTLKTRILTATPPPTPQSRDGQEGNDS